jgi:hypothetical protein
MHRRSREFKAESFELEGRVLLANARASIPGPAYVEFRSTSIPLSTTPTQTTPTQTTPTQTTPTQVVGQQDRVATVVLARNDNRGRLQVQVTTDPSSPAVGVNVGAVDQTVTFANRQWDAAVTVPILSGAPNPGEVDVNLTISSLAGSPQIMTTGPLELRILSSDATVPPQIVSTQGKPHGIVLTFSKPMNPVEASNVNNYAVRATKTSLKTNPFLVPIDVLTLPLHMDSSISTSFSASTHTVPLQAAEYDPATNSVTLILKRKFTYSGVTGITVTQGHPAKTSGQPGQQSNLGPGLTDLEGNPIGGELTPGKFSVSVFKGFIYPAY